ncbi:hypothetical protein D3C77_297360 [compost metagenome]
MPELRNVESVSPLVDEHVGELFAVSQGHGCQPAARVMGVDLRDLRDPVDGYHDIEFCEEAGLQTRTLSLFRYYPLLQSVCDERVYSLAGKVGRCIMVDEKQHFL